MTDTETRRRWLSPHIVLLFLIFAATAGIAIWQGSNRPTPTIFTDEIEMAQRRAGACRRRTLSACS